MQVTRVSVCQSPSHHNIVKRYGPLYPQQPERMVLPQGIDSRLEGYINNVMANLYGVCRQTKKTDLKINVVTPKDATPTLMLPENKRGKNTTFIGVAHATDLINAFGGGELTDYVIYFTGQMATIQPAKARGSHLPGQPHLPSHHRHWQ